MSAQEPATQPAGQQPSVLELCMAQQSDHQSGIRLSFNPEIADSITLEKLPYHYCAVTGNVNLAAFLYVQKVPFSKGITIANFAADGKDGSTPWKKPVMLSPLDIANMAGHRPAALVLALVGGQVPLHWSRDNHHSFPRSFKIQAKLSMEGLVSTPFFASLPGTARIQVVDNFMTSLAQETVWSSLSSEVWAGQWQECVGDDFEQAQQMPIAQQGGDKVTADNAAMASYQFQIRARQRNASRWGARWLLGLGVGLAAMETCNQLGCSDPGVNAAVLCAGLTQPVSTAICLGLSALFRKTMKRH